MPIGTYVDTRTISCAATASSTITHGLSNAPHIIIGTAKFNSSGFVSSSTGYPYFSAKGDSASVSVWNRGLTAETWSVSSIFLHTIIR